MLGRCKLFKLPMLLETGNIKGHYGLQYMRSVYCLEDYLCLVLPLESHTSKLGEKEQKEPSHYLLKYEDQRKTWV